MAPARRSGAEKLFAAIDPAEYESNMTVLAVVEEEDFVGNVQEIAVFDGNVCLASAMVQEDGYFFLTIPGNSTVTNRLSLLAVVDGNIVKTSTSLYFSEDATFGDFDSPFVVTFAGTTSIDQMLATDNYCRMQVVDLGGRVVYSGTPDEFNEIDFMHLTKKGHRQLADRFLEKIPQIL